MNEVGEFLRRERELRRITLEEVADSTKISRRYLEAIEEGRYASLPGEAFVRGFVRAYAQSIGLDASEAMLMYNQARPATEAFPTRPTQTVPDRRPSNAHPLLWLLLGGLVIVGGVLFSFVSFQQQPAPLQAKVPPHTRAPTPAPLAPALPLSSLVLTAIADSDTWLRVTIDGKVQQDVLLRAGQTTKWKGYEQFALSIGNARGTRLKLNGRELAIPIAAPNLLRQYTVSREMLK